MKHYASTLRSLPQRRRDEAMHEVRELLLLRQGVPDEELEKNAQASLYNEDPSMRGHVPMEMLLWSGS